MNLKDLEWHRQFSYGRMEITEIGQLVYALLLCYCMITLREWYTKDKFQIGCSVHNSYFSFLHETCPHVT